MLNERGNGFLTIPILGVIILLLGLTVIPLLESGSVETLRTEVKDLSANDLFEQKVSATRSLQPDCLYYNFEEGSGNSVFDLSTSGGNDGARNGQAAYTGTSRHGNYAMSFPANWQAHVSLQDPQNNLHQDTEYTFMAWIKVNGGGLGGLVMLGGCCNPRNGYSIQTSGSSIRFWGGSDNDNSNYNTNTNINIVDNQWHHIAITCNQNTLRMYVDGNQNSQGTENVPTTPRTGGNDNRNGPLMCIGGDNVDGQCQNTRIIDEVAVFGRELSQSEIQQAMEGLRPVPSVESVRAGDTDNGTCYARYRPYTLSVNVTSPRQLNDIAELKVHLDYNTTNATLCYNWTRDEFFKLQDENSYMELITNMCDITNNGADKWWLNFTVNYNFSFPHEGWVDCFANVTANDGESFQNRFPWLCRVENDLDFKGELKITGEYQGELEQGDWVRGAEMLNLTGLTVHYQDAQLLYPAEKYFDVKVADAGGNIWWDNQSRGENMFISMMARDVMDPYEELYVTIVSIPADGYSTTNITTPLKIDSEAPLPPGEIKTYAYGKQSPFTKHRSINITWQEVQDNASGLKGYYYSNRDNSFTPNGSFTDLTEGEIRGLSEGYNSIFVWCEDKVGNIGYAFSAGIQVDLTGVFFSNFTPSDETWLNESAIDCSVDIQDFGGIGVDGSSVFYSISTSGPHQFGSWVPVWVPEDSIVMTVEAKCKLEEGDDNYIKWKAMDVAGNDYSESEPWRLKVDTSPAEFSDELLTRRIWYLYREIPTTIEVWDRGESGIDMDSFQVRMSTEGDDKFSPWMDIPSGNLTTVEEGRVQVTATFKFEPGVENYIQFRGTDIAGNPVVHSKTFNLRVDVSPVEFGEFIIEDMDDLPEVECSIRVSDQDSGVDIESIYYSFTSEGDLEGRYSDWISPEPMNIITGNPFVIYCNLPLEWGRDNYVRFMANDAVGWDDVITPGYRINVTSAPTAKITRPEDRRTEFREDQVVEFDGSGSFDLDGDNLTYAWSSNISGVIGSNSTVILQLTPGNHTITLTIADPDNNTASDDVLVDIKRLSSFGKDDDDDDATGTGTGVIGSGGGSSWWWWIIIAVIILLLLLLIMLLVVRRRKKKGEGEDAAEPKQAPQPPIRRPQYPYPHQPQSPPQYQGGPAQQQSVYPHRYNMNQSQRPGLPGPAPQYPALPQHAGPRPSPASKRHGIQPPAPPSETQQLPPPKEAPPQYQLPSFSTAEGEQDLNRMALPPAPDEVDGGLHEHTKELKKASPPPPPGMEEAQEGAPEEEKKEEEKEKSSPSLDTVFSGLIDTMSDSPPPPSSPKPSPSVPMNEEPPEPKEDEPKTLQCHSCSREYRAIIESFPSVVQCPFCGAQGMIGSL